MCAKLHGDKDRDVSQKLKGSLEYTGETGRTSFWKERRNWKDPTVEGLANHFNDLAFYLQSSEKLRDMQEC